jgi:hypothetical protein
VRFDSYPASLADLEFLGAWDQSVRASKMTEDYLVRFEARELSIYVEYVPADQLQHEHAYFIVSFLDDEMALIRFGGQV